MLVQKPVDHRGEPGHEICFIYQATIDADALDALDGVAVPDIPEDDVEVGRVFALDELLTLEVPLYPDGVAELLARGLSPTGR